MADIKVKEVESDQTGWVFDVAVREGGTESRHRVTLSKNDYDALTAGEAEPEKLVESSFEFLLEREPKESILSKFDLSVISNYFPEFENRIKDYI
jgi:hypothetical protein